MLGIIHVTSYLAVTGTDKPEFIELFIEFVYIKHKTPEFEEEI